MAKLGPTGPEAQVGTEALVRPGWRCWRGAEGLHPGLQVVRVGGWGGAPAGAAASTGLIQNARPWCALPGGALTLSSALLWRGCSGPHRKRGVGGSVHCSIAWVCS